MSQIAHPLEGAARPRTTPSWTVIPTLALAGFVSSIFYEWFIFEVGLYYASHGDTPFRLVTAACFGIAVCGALVLRGDISIRAGVICALSTTVLIFLASDQHSPFYKVLSSDYRRGEMDWSIVYRAVAIVLPMYVVFGWFTARSRLRWIPWIGLVCGGVAIANLARISWDHRFAKMCFSWCGITLDESWQINVAGFLGLALWLQAVDDRRRFAAEPARDTGTSARARLAVAAFLALFFAAVGFSSHAAIRLALKRNRVEPGSVDALAAEYQGLMSDPAKLPAVTQKPPGEVLLLTPIGNWTPQQPSVTAHPVPPAQKDSWPCPCQSFTYEVEYEGGGLDIARIQITEYPNSAWAQHDLKNNDLQKILRPSPFLKRVTILNSDVYQIDNDFTWTSGNKTIWFEPQIDRHGTAEQVLEEYIRAYPSSIR